MPLPYHIEHCLPDYHLYDDYVCEQIKNGKNVNKFRYYTDYSIGFMTRGCFRHCEFCVNKNYNKSCIHSPLHEFLDNSRKKICLLDDNFLACSDWERMLITLQETGKPFQFKQGLDERLLTDKKCQILFKSKYDGDYIFAFDDVKDYEIIESKLKLIRKYTDKQLRFYLFCGFDRNNKWDKDFWENDLRNLFIRIELLIKYKCLPYIMRYERYNESPYRGTYISLARWCNQPSIFKKKTYQEFIEWNIEYSNSDTCSEKRYYDIIKKNMPELIEEYFSIKW